MHVPEKTDMSSLHGRMLSRRLKKSLFSPAQPRRAGVGRVRSLAFLSLLQDYLFVGHITYADHRSIRMAL
jgi:hypothetical protein